MVKRKTLIALTSLSLAGVLLSGFWPQRVEAAPAASQEGVTASASGEVRRIDAAGGKITIKHGEIQALELPAMTLVYQIDPALLAKVKPGDTVKFTATRRGSQYVVTAIN